MPFSWHLVFWLGVLLDFDSCSSIHLLHPDAPSTDTITSSGSIRVSQPQIVIRRQPRRFDDKDTLTTSQNVTFRCHKSDGSKYQFCAWHGPNMDSGQDCTLRQECGNRSVTLTDDGVTCSLRIEVNFEQESMVENLGKWKCRLIEKYAGGFHPKYAQTSLDYVDDSEPFVTRVLEGQLSQYPQHRDRMVMTFTPKVSRWETQEVEFRCVQQFPAPMNRLTWYYNGEQLEKTEYYSIDRLVFDNAQCDNGRPWPIINSTRSFPVSAKDFGNRISCRVEKLGRDGRSLFPEPRVFETDYTLKMAIEPSIENAKIIEGGGKGGRTTGTKIRVQLEAFPPVSQVAITYKCNKVGERPLSGCCRRDEIEECHLEYECNYTNHISFKCLSRGLGGSPSPIHHPANRVESSAIVDVARISKYTYQMVVEPPNRDLNGVTAVTVSVENHYARTNRTFETSDLIPVAAWSAEDAVQIIPNKADIIRAAVVVMSAMIIILLILAICLLWKFRKSISEYCKCGEYLVVDDYEEDQIVVVHAPEHADTLAAGCHVPKTTEL